MAATHVVLPVAVDDHTLTVAATDVDARPIFEQISFATARRVVAVLAVEPLMLLCRALAHDGYEVEAAGTGEKAVQKLRGRRPDLLLLDAMLPGLHGFEICSRLKGSEAYRDVPVVMISAVYRGWQHARKIQEVHGADAFVEKPFDVHYVRKLAAELLGRPLARAELSAERAAAWRSASPRPRGRRSTRM